MGFNLFDRIIFKITSWMGDQLLKIIRYLPITPNQLTLFNALIFIPLASYFFSKGTYEDNLLGLLLVFIHGIFDEVDGKLARLKDLRSKLGIWLDPKLDVIASGAILAGVCVGFFRTNPMMNNLFLTTYIFFLHYAIQVISLEYKNPKYDLFSELIKLKESKNKINFWEQQIRNFITLDSSIFVFFGTFRYFLLICVLTNTIQLFMLVFGLFNTIRFVIMFWIFALSLSGQKTKSRIINSLRPFLSD